MFEGARPADDDDLPTVVELWQEAQADVGRVRGGQLLIQRELPAGPAAEHLAAALSDPAATVVVGTLSDHVVGYGLGRREVLADGARLGRVAALYVVPAARGVGVGEAMMERLVAWFARQGCRGVDAEALPGDRASKSFWEDAGFRARLITMHRDLHAGPAS